MDKLDPDYVAKEVNRSNSEKESTPPPEIDQKLLKEKPETPSSLSSLKSIKSYIKVLVQIYWPVLLYLLKVIKYLYQS